MEQHLESTVNTVPTSASEPSKIGVAVAPETQDVTSEQNRDCASSKPVTTHQLPIPPASEPMQYRAIGLIKGTYVPSEEQFTRGTLMTDDNQPIDAVLLGRVMSLVKKHVDLATPHLWVVYPRTRPKNEHLHAQIVGIWEPDNLHRDGDDIDDEAEEQPDTIEVTSTVTRPDEESQEAIDLEHESSSAESLNTNNPDEEFDDSVTGNSITENDESVIDDSITETGESTADDGSIRDKSNLAQEHSTLVADDSIPQDLENLQAKPARPEKAHSKQTGSTTTKLVKPARPKFSAADVQAPNKGATEMIAQKPIRPGMPEKTVEPAPSVESPSTTNLKDGYFSIRGEVLQFSPDTQEITVRIRQANRKSASAKDDQPKDDKEFKLQLQGLLQGRAVGYFWDFHVQRSGNNLVVDEATMIGIVPPRKIRRKKFGGKGGGRGGLRRRPEVGRSGDRPTRSGDRPTPAPARRGASSKPVLKKSSVSSDSSSDAPKAES